MERYEKIAPIGRGRYGWVHKGYDHQNRKTVALKEVYFVSLFDEVPNSLIREVTVLKDLKHNNIVRLLDVVNNEDKVYLVLEHMETDLKKLMKESPHQFQDSELVKKLMYQILQGVTHCHHVHKVFHRDLKPQNLLINSEDFALKVADFGLARKFELHEEPNYTPDVGTPSYRAPEILFGTKQYTSSVDVWSVGCIFAEMVNQKPLFPGPLDHNVLDQMFSTMGTPTEETWPGVTSMCVFYDCLALREPKNLAEVVPGLKGKGLDLLSKMLCMNPNGRITAEDALRHEYFKEPVTS